MYIVEPCRDTDRFIEFACGHGHLRINQFRILCHSLSYNFGFFFGPRPLRRTWTIFWICGRTRTTESCPSRALVYSLNKYIHIFIFLFYLFGPFTDAVAFKFIWIVWDCYMGPSMELEKLLSIDCVCVSVCMCVMGSRYIEWWAGLKVEKVDNTCEVVDYADVHDKTRSQWILNTCIISSIMLFISAYIILILVLFRVLTFFFSSQLTLLYLDT